MTTTPAAHRLVLVRHAKADWPVGVPNDHDRPLAERGRRDAPAIGRWLRESRINPGLAVVSTARRTLQTWELASAALRSNTPAELDDRVYGASVEELLTVLRGTAESVGTVLVVGHSPGTEGLALALQDGAGNAGDLEVLARFPTAALAVLDVPGPWGELADGTCRLSAVAVPRG